jgi:hypothetical protein
MVVPSKRDRSAVSSARQRLSPPSAWCTHQTEGGMVEHAGKVQVDVLFKRLNGERSSGNH